MKKNQNKSRLIVFDSDGVLFDNYRGGFKEILVLLGKAKEVQIIDEEYQKRKHLGPWGLEELALLYKGFSQDVLKKISESYCLTNLMDGAKETVNELKERNFIIGSISSNPIFILESLADLLSLDFYDGNKLEFNEDIATGKILKKVDRYIKADILMEKMKKYQTVKTNTVVIGDSLTDLPMSEHAGIFIAFNAKPEVEERADILIKKKDLREILPYLP